MKTYQAKHKDVIRGWHQVDADGKVLGRLASSVAFLLIGKHKPTYTPHMDSGDFVVVTNADKIRLTGKKEKQKVYTSHSGYPGGFKEVKYLKMKKDHPERVIELAVSGMLPKNRLRDDRLRRLKVFVGTEHKYQDKFKTESKETKKVKEQTATS